MQDGGQDLVNSLNLVPRETDHFHGVGYSFEIGPIVDARLERETERRKSFVNYVFPERFVPFSFLFQSIKLGYQVPG